MSHAVRPMPFHRALASLALLLLTPLAGAGQAPITFGTSHTIQSDVLGEARTVNVWVPPGGKADERAPYRVLYLIDGGTDQDWFHIAGIVQLGALSWTFEPMILVGIETVDRQGELTSPAADPGYATEFPTAGGAEAFRAYITEEVAPFINETYPVSGETAIIGESLAGLFIVDTYLKTPSAFDDYIAISPSLWWDDEVLGRQAAAYLAGGQHAGKRLYLAAADEGGAMQAGIDRLREAAGAAKTGFTYADYSSSETHATIFHRAALDAVRALYGEGG